MALLNAYQSLLSLSERMVAHAREQEWDQLVALESERSALSTKLPAKLPELPPAEAQSIAEAIKHILECNAIIHEHVAPWMAHVATLLAAFAPKKG